jgi:hypothetical protein
MTRELGETDPLDVVDDVCDRCRHTLDPEGACPSCSWTRPRDEGPARERPADDLPGIRGG